MSARPPRFSIVVVHYQGTVPHSVFCRGIESLRAQTFPDYEILAYHDGPLLNPTVALPVPVRCTEVRYNDWGHSLRDRGIREARGEYIVHFNADNVLYPSALEEINREIERPQRLLNGEPIVEDTNEIIIFPIRMWGLMRPRDRVIQYKGDPKFYLILTGIPPVVQNIDCMQFVMKRELWLREGGWADKRELSDGFQYQKFARKYGYRAVGPILGDHF